MKFHENHPVRVELLHSERKTHKRTHGQTEKRTELTKLIVASLRSRVKNKLFRLGQ